MNLFQLKPKTAVRWDLVALGEILLRFDPLTSDRIQGAQDFRVYAGGAEFNVAANLARVFRRQTAAATALADNALGRLAEAQARAAGVDTSKILWRDADESRNGLYFIERGYGVRAGSSVFDRANTAISNLKTGELDWNEIFGVAGSRWFHTGGVFSGLSPTAPRTTFEAMKAAKDNGIIVSYDLNYRHSLWKKRGGMPAANGVNEQLLPLADVVFGMFGFNSSLAHFKDYLFQEAAGNMMRRFPNLKVVVSSLREVHSASRHDFGAACYDGDAITLAKNYTNVEVYDRVGSGDAFAAGFIEGVLRGENLQFALDCGAAMGVLTMTTAGDNLTAAAADIAALMSNETAHVKR